MSQRTKWIISGVLLLIALIMGINALWSGPNVDDLAASDKANDRLQAVLIIQERKSDSPELLGRLASDPAPQVALQAITVMGQNRSVDHRRKLVEILNNERNATVRGAAAAALGHYKTTTVAELTSLMRSTEQREVRVGAAKGLARLGRHNRKTTGHALMTALRDPDPEVRIWAITGIYHISGHQFPGFNAQKSPAEQESVIRFIENKLREKGLI